MGPFCNCWEGSPNKIALIVTVMEQDDSDNDSHVRYTSMIHLLVRVCVVLETLGGDPAYQSAPHMIRTLLEPIENGEDQDDLIESKGSSLSAGLLSFWARHPEYVSHGIPYDFITRHRGDGADLRVYFRVRGKLPAPTQLSPPHGTVFNHYPRRTTLRWSPVPAATSYGVEVQFEDTTWRPWIRKSGIPATSYTFYFVGAQPGRWRVWAEANGQQSPKTGWWEFRYTR